MDPITYPTVELDGTTYTLKVSLASLRRLREGGFSSDAPAPSGDGLNATQFYGHNIAVQLSACAHVQKNGKLVHAGLSPSDAEDIILPMDIPRIQAAMVEAMVKVTPAETPPVQPAES